MYLFCIRFAFCEHRLCSFHDYCVDDNDDDDSYATTTLPVNHIYFLRVHISKRYKSHIVCFPLELLRR